ncbi:TonB-linked SusC/RagA family outer membrane protein [Flavobacterium sp. CG_9.1]|uniref:SusC/RagA family TonB-linked outer membrane protein n=1 Tax=Flavobacterium sp. CG_9.1 TaxID=2787728 RepID=UPI0018C95C4F|nr:TonB-dependent receptor [Flavobacterium sp. CG_9.1]MBG6062948.1 TonB-linked SusC/RagA family outer membrane protein [Flavobacterium sp. CG_9.1]
MRLKFKWVFSLVLALSMQFSFAQERTVSGVVSDASGPVPGANVVVKGSRNGVQTDFDGKYSIKAKVGDVLVASFVGMQDVAVKVGISNTVNIKLQDGSVLEEVVVVGYGTQKRRDVNGAIAKIAGDRIKDIPVQSFDQALSGAASGVNVSQPNGVLGNQAVIRIRGVNSITLSSYPLIVIDGVPSWNGDNLNQNQAANNPLANINQADIESIEVLKDASSAAIYGSRAAAGVILITTKKGKAGKFTVNFDSSVSFTKPFNLIDVLDAQQFTDIKNEGLRNAGIPANGTTRGFYTMNDANGKLVDTNWYDLIYRTGVATNHSVSISGGNENTKYFLSAGQLEQEGMFVNNDFRRQTGRFTLDQKVTSWLTLGGTFNYTNSRNNGISTGSVAGSTFDSSGAARLAFAQAPNVGPFNNDGTYNLAPTQIGQGNNLTPLQWPNVKYILDNNKISNQNDHFISNFYVGLKLAKGLNFKSLYGIDNLLVENKDFLGPLNGNGQQFIGVATNTMNRYSRKSIQNILDYNVSLSDNHNLSALVGSERQYSKIDAWGASRRGVSDPFFNEYQGGFNTIVVSGNLLTENYLESYFGRVNYDYNKKYFVSLNARRDGYSAFAPDNKWGNFWGGSLGWNLTEESFFKNIVSSDIVNQLKLRASYGVVGNNQGLNDFASSSFYDAGVNGSNTTLFYNRAGNEKLKWETSNKTDLGLNFSLFNDRISGELGYYKNDIDGLILSVPQAASAGIPGNSILANVGSMRNTGYEATLSGKILDKGNFKWNASFNITSQKNLVTALDANNSDIIVATQLENTNIIRVGQSIGNFYIVQTGGVNPANGRRIFFHGDGTAVQYDHSAPVATRWTKVSDGSVTRAANQALDAKVMGPALPTFFGGFNNTFAYKGFDLNVSIYFSGGNYVYNGTQAGLRDQRVWNNSVDVLNRWQNPGDVTDIPRIVFGDNVSNGSSMPISANLEKGDFMKVRNIALGYNLPKSFLDRMKLTSFRFYVSAQNAFTFTNYSGFDPEISSNGNANGSPSVDRNSAPMARTFSFGFNLGL